MTHDETLAAIWGRNSKQTGSAGHLRSEDDTMPRYRTPKCDQCQVLVVQNVPCHETGCPNSWVDPLTGRGYKRKCAVCDGNFTPSARGQTKCSKFGCGQ